jgi:drug/metabolite transporter (DMT)-like permease
MTRRIPARVPTLLVAVAMAAVVAVLCLAWTTWEGWAPMTGAQWTAVGGSAVLVAVGYYLVIVAMRVGDVSLTGAFRYTAVPWGAALGYLLWDELPDAVSVAGVALILGAGLYALLSERRERRETGLAT